MTLVYDYVRWANFTTKPCLQGKFSAFAFCGWIFFSNLLPQEFFYAKLRNLTISKWRLEVKFGHLTTWIRAMMLEPPIICSCILTWSTLSYADSMWSILNCSSAIISSFSFLMSSLSFLVFLSSSSVEATFYKWRKISQLVIHMKNYTCCWFKLLFTVQKGAFSVPGTSAIESW